MKMIDAKEVHARHMAEDPEYCAAYESMEEGFTLIKALLKISFEPISKKGA